MKKLFVAATRQDDGKSTLSLGLLQILKKSFSRLGFMKPVGQRYIIKEGCKIDEDVALMRDVCQMKESLADMNPVVVEKGFTEEYILKGKKEVYIKKIKTAFERVSREKDLTLIEGTGHAGVGAVFDLSNASVAKLLGSKVLLISTGGIGRPIDEIMINKALFDQERTEIIGVVLNKVLPEKYEKIKEITNKGLERKGIKLLGVVPFRKCLTYPTMEQIREAIDGEILYGEEHLENRVVNILVAAMEPYHALSFIRPKSLVIVPGDREDIILGIMAGHMSKTEDDFEVNGMILTGGLMPHDKILGLIRSGSLPVLISKDDTYTTAKKVHERRVKIRSSDKDKVKKAKELVTKYIDTDEIVARM